MNLKEFTLLYERSLPAISQLMGLKLPRGHEAALEKVVRAAKFDEWSQIEGFLADLCKIAGVNLAQLPSWMMKKAHQPQATPQQDALAKELISLSRNLVLALQSMPCNNEGHQQIKDEALAEAKEKGII